MFLPQTAQGICKLPRNMLSVEGLRRRLRGLHGWLQGVAEDGIPTPNDTTVGWCRLNR